ncbi:hypothetical protein [Streptomyces sp. NPDC089919]|uniref:hypothetical protein n=1 Tax=Streptomyces sp. NPDC089919 TaxID=3155188 RepID=UPI00341C4A4D
MRRTVFGSALLVCLVAGSVAGCTPLEEPLPSSKKVAARMAAVESAWQGRSAARDWSEHFYPVGTAEQLPRGGFRTAADRLAYAEGRYLWRAKFPDALPVREVRGLDGRIMDMSQTQGPFEAFAALDRAGDEDGTAPLVVTALAPTVLSVESSMGWGLAPAWSFTLRGYDTPLIRLVPEFGGMPSVPSGQLPAAPRRMGRLIGQWSVPGDARNLTVLAQTNCGEDVSVRVREAPKSVVLAGVIRRVPTDQKTCGEIHRVKAVRVVLREPLGTRAPVDAECACALPLTDIAEAARRSLHGPRPTPSTPAAVPSYPGMAP